MKKKWVYKLIVLFASFILFLSGCEDKNENSSDIYESMISISDIGSINNSSNNEPTSTPVPESISLKYEIIGIESGNFNNQSRAVMTDDGIIFVALYDLDNLTNEALFMIKGDEETKIYSGYYFSSFNLITDKLYFLSSEVGFGVLDINTNEVTRYAETENITKMLVIDDWILYTQKDQHLWAMRIDGTDMRRITDFSCYSEFYVYEDRLYCIGAEDNFLYSVTLDGTDKKLILDNEILNFNISDGWIYFSEMKDFDSAEENDPSLTKMRVDGAQQKVICNDYASSINVSGDWIYYSNRSSEGELYRIKTDGTLREQLDTEYDVFGINVLNDRIIYSAKVEENHTVYSLKTDVSDKTVLRYYYWWYTSD